jgi:hypothetical protein
MYKCVTTQVDSSLTDLYTGSWSPSHVDLCCFKGSVLVPLEWRHQTLSYFGFSTYSHISHMCSPIVMWPKSNHIAAFALDLKSAYEGEHRIFGLLSLANLAQNDVLQFHPFIQLPLIPSFLLTCDTLFFFAKRKHILPVSDWASWDGEEVPKGFHLFLMHTSM